MSHARGLAIVAAATFVLLRASTPSHAAGKEATSKPSPPVTITGADVRWIELGRAQPPFGPHAFFEIRYVNRAPRGGKAAVFCELRYRDKAGKDVLETLSFHDVKLARGASKLKVHFQTLHIALKGRGALNVYLANATSPSPKPPRVFSMALSTMVWIIDKRRIAQYKKIKEQIRPNVLSNVFSIPVAADAKSAKELQQDLGPAKATAKP